GASSVVSPIAKEGLAGVRGRADAAQAGATESDARGGKREPAESGDLLARIYEQHREDVYRFLFRRVRDAEDAADLTQDVFAEAAAKMPTVRDDRPALPWLYAVARRRLVDEWRSANRRRPGPQRIAGGEPVAAERVVGLAGALVA